MKKPSAKFIIVMNVVANLPMAIAMSVTAALLAKQPLFTLNLLINILIGFVLACLINLVLPIQKITHAFPAMFKLNPESFWGSFVGNIPACFIFVGIIGFIMSLYNVRQAPAFIFAYIGTFIPLYIVCFIVSMIFVPIAIKAATAAEKKEV